MFQHTAARRRLVVGLGSILIGFMFQHTAARRRLVTSPTFAVSAKDCFNTQPPEGGWSKTYINAFPSRLFQHTAARRRLVATPATTQTSARVSTHSRPKAAGYLQWHRTVWTRVSTHSRPKAAGVDQESSVLDFSPFQHTAARRRLGNTSR